MKLINYYFFPSMSGEEKKGTRGATKMTELTKLAHKNCLNVQFDNLGNSIGRNRIKFNSYLSLILI